MNSYIPYVGGKTKAVGELKKILQPLPGETYVEPFLGGASVFFGLAPAGLSILSDADPDVMCMHQAVAANPEAVQRELGRLPLARLQYEELRQLRERADWWDMSPERRAAAMIYLYSVAFDARPQSPFPADTTRRRGPDLDRDWQPWSDMLSQARLECLSALELIDRYVLQPTALRALVYCDPPYVVAKKKSHYRLNFAAADHLLLAERLAQVNERNGSRRHVRVAVSYDDDPYIRALYRPEFGWRVQSLSLRYAAGNHAHKTDELLILNFDPESD